MEPERKKKHTKLNSRKPYFTLNSLDLYQTFFPEISQPYPFSALFLAFLSRQDEKKWQPKDP